MSISGGQNIQLTGDYSLRRKIQFHKGLKTQTMGV